MAASRGRVIRVVLELSVLGSRRKLGLGLRKIQRFANVDVLNSQCHGRGWIQSVGRGLGRDVAGHFVEAPCEGASNLDMVMCSALKLGESGC